MNGEQHRPKEVATSKARGANLSASLREMAAVGIPVDLSVAELDVEIEQVGGLHGNMVFDLPDGRAGCIIDLLIVNQTSRPILVRDVELRPPWSNSGFEWLPDPEEAGCDPFNYNFPGKGAPVLPRDQVINHVLLDRGMLKPGRPVEGWLLGIGNPKPEKLLLGGPVEVTLSIIGHNHCEYEKKITLGVDPSLIHRPKSSRISFAKGLFAQECAQNLRPPNFGNTAKNPGRGSADEEGLPRRKSCR